MITYQKVSHLRLERAEFPQPPFWQATAVLPYGPVRGAPLAINYLTLTATAKRRMDVSVARSAESRLDREKRLDEPVLVESSEVAELVFRRGEDASRFLAGQGIRFAQLISTTGRLPDIEPQESMLLAIACWPLMLRDIEAQFAEARKHGFRWGAIVPVVYPVTTDEKALAGLADLAASNGASFLCGVPIDLDPPARNAVASSLPSDDSTIHTLFDGDLEEVSVAAERLVAALAFDRGMADHVTLSHPDARGNWNAAAHLAFIGSRLIRMKDDVELGWALMRSSKLIAQLYKPVAMIAAAASLSIIEGLDAASVTATEEWLRRGTSELSDKTASAWRMR